MCCINGIVLFRLKAGAHFVRSMLIKTYLVLFVFLLSPFFVYKLESCTVTLGPNEYVLLSKRVISRNWISTAKSHVRFFMLGIDSKYFRVPFCNFSGTVLETGIKMELQLETMKCLIL